MPQDVSEFCRLFYLTTSMPITYYHVDGKFECFSPAFEDGFNFTQGILAKLSNTSKNPDYFTTRSHVQYGIVRLLQSDAYRRWPLFGSQLYANNHHQLSK